MVYADDDIIGRSMKVINKVIWETKEVTNDKGLKIKTDKIKHVNTSKNKYNN
jgi:hypothetical protein